MKKLFLTSFVFITGDVEHKGQRLVVAATLDEAYEKAQKWFPQMFPESILSSIITHPAIE